VIVKGYQVPDQSLLETIAWIKQQTHSLTAAEVRRQLIARGVAPVAMGFHWITEEVQNRLMQQLRKAGLVERRGCRWILTSSGTTASE
jgi:hypothetical protein